MIELLKKLITFENPSVNIDANERVLLFCQKHLANKGIPSNLVWFADHPCLQWGAPINETRVLLNTHVDVVPAPKECFLPRIKEGKLFGRGSADTKAMVAVLLSLTTADIHLASRNGVSFALVSDEEIAGDTTALILEKIPTLEFGLFGEMTQLKINNEAKGIMQIKITTHGKQCHGSRPWEGSNALIMMSAQLQSFMTAHPIPKEYTWDTTFNFARINAGEVINQTPASSELWCDVRLNPNDCVQRIIKEFEQHFTLAKIEIIRSESHIFTDAESPYLRCFRSSLEQSGVAGEFSRELGSSDARHCTNLGIPCAVFGPIGGNIHQDDEWVDIASIQTTQKVIKNFISRYSTSASC